MFEINTTPDYTTYFSGKSNHLITHRFTNGYEVTVDTEAGLLGVYKNEELKNTCNIKDYTVEQYEKYLQEIANQE